MEQVGWKIELLVHESKTELYNEVLRSCVRRMVSGEERISTDVFEGEFYERTGRLLCQTATPGGRPQVNSQYKATSFDLIGTEAGLTGKFVRLGKENRPVLDFVRRGKLNFRAHLS